MPIHPLDITVLVITGFTTFQGLRRGLIRSIFDILAFIAAIALAMLWHGQVATFLIDTLHWAESIATVASFFAVWISIYLVVSLIGGGLHRLIRSSIFGPLNILSGGLLGLTKGVLFIGLFLQFALALPLPREASQTLSDSQAIRWILPLAEATSPYLFQSTHFSFPLLPKGEATTPPLPAPKHVEPEPGTRSI